MNKIDQLIIKARAAARPSTELLPSLVWRCGRSWTAELHLWDAVAGTQSIKRTACSTEAAAVKRIRAAAKEYNNSKDVPIIIIDV